MAAFMRKYVSPKTGPSNIELELYSRPVEVLASHLHEIDDRTLRLEERLADLESVHSDLNIAIEAHQARQGSLNDQLSEMHAESQTIRDQLFELQQTKRYVSSAHARAVRHAQMAEEGKQLAAQRAAYQEPYAAIQVETEVALTETVLLWARAHGVDLSGVQWSWWVTHILELRESFGIAQPQDLEFQESLARSRALVQECQRLSVLAMGADHYFPSSQFFVNARNIILETKGN